MWQDIIILCFKINAVIFVSLSMEEYISVGVWNFSASKANVLVNDISPFMRC